MCLAKEGESPKASLVGDTVPSPRSPWAKLLNRQNLKPRLPRKVASSARVNLNKCWSKFGELLASKSYSAEPEILVLPFAEYFFPTDPVKPAPSPEEENLTNSCCSNGNRFEIIPHDGAEVTENLANEVREICYSSQNCFVCSLT